MSNQEGQKSNGKKLWHKFMEMLEAYSEPYLTSMKELFVKKVNE